MKKMIVVLIIMSLTTFTFAANFSDLLKKTTRGTSISNSINSIENRINSIKQTINEIEAKEKTKQSNEVYNNSKNQEPVINNSTSNVQNQNAKKNKNKYTMSEYTDDILPFYLTCEKNNGKNNWYIKYTEFNTDNGALLPSKSSKKETAFGVSFNTVSSNSGGTIRGYAYDGSAKNDRGETLLFPSKSTVKTSEVLNDGTFYIKEENVIDIYQFFKDSTSIELTIDTRVSDIFRKGDGTYSNIYEFPVSQIDIIVSFIETVLDISI